MPVGYTEQEIINGCRDGNRAVQEVLYRNYFSIYMKVCVRYTRNPEDAEQVLNDGFLKIFTKISSFGGQGSFPGWMHRIMVNTCLDFLRSHELRTGMQMHINSEMIEDSLLAATTANLAIDKLEFKELVNLIQVLPAMTRTVFNLFVFEGMSHKQIAAALPISEGTSQWHVHQARHLLQKKIKSINAREILYATNRI